MADSVCIPLSRAPKTTPLFLDYLYHYDRVARFYSGSPLEFARFQSVASAIAGRYPHRAQLAGILERQNRAFGCGEETIANIRRLRDSNTFVVVSGQQVGLFSGPAFTLYKALTVVRLAAQLTSKGLGCVPVFWLATEDHDLEEVAKTAVLNDAGELVPLEVGGERPAPACSVGYVKLSGQVSEALAAAEAALPAGEMREHLMLQLRECYAPGVRWGEAFGRLVTRLFSRFGVILLDPLEAEVHDLARPQYSKALSEAAHLRELLEARSRELIAAGYHAQVHVGDDSTLMFAAVEGRRTPVHLAGDRFAMDGRGPATLPQMEAWVESRSIDFTPSALLRPVVEDSLLPTIAYVPGPSELAYFAQSQSIYQEFGRPMPVLYPRAGFTLAARNTHRILEKYHLSLDDVWQGEDELRRKIARAGGGEDGAWAERMDRGEAGLKSFMDELAPDVERLDPTLTGALLNAREKMIYQLDRLRGKLSRAALDHSEILARHEKALLAQLTPSGKFQERVVSGINFLGRTGDGLLADLLEHIQTRCMDHQYVVCC